MTAVAGARPLRRPRLRHDVRALAGAWAIAAIVAAPIVALVVIALGADDNVWPHILGVVLPNAIFDTTILLIGVGLIAAVVGIATAWLVATCRSREKA